ncbi:P-loop containing nucleoside triphosphate hydrolase protein [Cladochytrium replicatum]|nr:P-loop containing nucleoside triphosphate hydrolase protein [Cladochytrium replicatum]
MSFKVLETGTSVESEILSESTSPPTGLSSQRSIHLRWSNISKHVEVQEPLPVITGEGGRESLAEITRSVSTALGLRRPKTIKKQILHHASGEIKPGELVALLGPSGSGKTTLLNVLGGRATYEQDEGYITVNGVKTDKSMKRFTAYILQEDIFFDLTVRQQLLFTALLRLPEKMSYSEKVARVDEMIAALGLAGCENSRITTISGGEKKRTNIATELLTDPALVLLDEPTSGLDSTSAVSLIRLLRELTEKGKTIITSIHQPSSQVFLSFDRVILLADGKTIYNGDPNKVVDYFASVGHPCPPLYNPADHIMDLVQTDMDVRKRLTEIYQHPPEVAEFADKGLIFVKDESEGTPPPITHKKFAVSFWTQMQVLLRRTVINKRGELFTTLNLFEAVIVAIIVGLIWFRMPVEISYITERSGFIFFIMTFWPINAAFSGLLVFPDERAVVNKERSSGSYRVSAYFLAKTFAEMPLILTLPVVFLIIAYFMSGLNPNVVAFLGFVIAKLIAVLAGESLGLFIGTGISELKTGLVVTTIAVLTFMLVGGFFAQHIPVYLAWLKYISVFYWAFMACQWFELTIGTPVFRCDPTANIAGTLSGVCKTASDTITGPEVLRAITGEDTNIALCFVMLVVLWLVFRIGAYINLRYLKHGIVRT